MMSSVISLCVIYAAGDSLQAMGQVPVTVPHALCDVPITVSGLAGNA